MIMSINQTITSSCVNQAIYQLGLSIAGADAKEVHSLQGSNSQSVDFVNVLYFFSMQEKCWEGCWKKMEDSREVQANKYLRIIVNIICRCGFKVCWEWTSLWVLDNFKQDMDGGGLGTIWSRLKRINTILGDPSEFRVLKTWDRIHALGTFFSSRVPWSLLQGSWIRCIVHHCARSSLITCRFAIQLDEVRFG